MKKTLFITFHDIAACPDCGSSTALKLMEEVDSSFESSYTEQIVHSTRKEILCLQCELPIRVVLPDSRLDVEPHGSSPARFGT